MDDDLFNDDPSPLNLGYAGDQQGAEDDPDEDPSLAVRFDFPIEGHLEFASQEEEEDELSDDSDEVTPKEKGPRDEIKVTVQSYQKAADDYIFDVEARELR